jgi:hypothetical protein
MHSIAANSPKTSNRQTIVQTGVVIAVLGSLSWSNDAWLFVRLRIVADDAFAFGDPHYPMLLMDGSDELLAYPPNRVAGFLSFPSSRIRTAACLSLAERDEDKNPEPWIGVAPKLINAYVMESDEIAKRCQRSALEKLPLVPAADADAVLSFVESADSEDPTHRNVYVSLARKVVASNPDRLPEVKAIAGEWLESQDADTRRCGAETLGSLKHCGTNRESSAIGD